MKITNFTIEKMDEDMFGPKHIFVTVEVVEERGFFRRKKTIKKRQAYSKYGDFWIFTDNGEPIDSVGRLFEIAMAKRKFSELS